MRTVRFNIATSVQTWVHLSVRISIIFYLSFQYYYFSPTWKLSYLSLNKPHKWGKLSCDYELWVRKPLQWYCGHLPPGILFSWWRHQMETISASLALCAGIHRSPVDSSHKGQWREALMFPLICAWTNTWANNRDAGDLRLHRAHYDVTVIC